MIFCKLKIVVQCDFKRSGTPCTTRYSREYDVPDITEVKSVTDFSDDAESRAVMAGWAWRDNQLLCPGCAGRPTAEPELTAAQREQLEDHNKHVEQKAAASASLRYSKFMPLSATGEQLHEFIRNSFGQKLGQPGITLNGLPYDKERLANLYAKQTAFPVGYRLVGPVISDELFEAMVQQFGYAPVREKTARQRPKPVVETETKREPVTKTKTRRKLAPQIRAKSNRRVKTLTDDEKMFAARYDKFMAINASAVQLEAAVRQLRGSGTFFNGKKNMAMAYAKQLHYGLREAAIREEDFLALVQRFGTKNKKDERQPCNSTCSSMQPT